MNADGKQITLDLSYPRLSAFIGGNLPFSATCKMSVDGNPFTTFPNSHASFPQQHPPPSTAETAAPMLAIS
jgi:hypothetical protein